MHILQITNHGIHQWQVVPGLPDTGGQNVFVNQFSAALADLGFEITIINRGGYPDPLTGEVRRGIDRKDKRQRILYLEDGLDKFVRKENMDERLPYLVEDLRRRLEEDETAVDLIISHYWDGAKLGVLYNATLENPVPHIWAPHSLGAIKKGNFPPDQWAGLRIDERLANEKRLVQQVDGIASTSSLITKKLDEFYDYRGPLYFLPPCVEQDRYYPRDVPEDHKVWDLLAQLSGRTIGEIQRCKIVTEISRTDITKRKDILIRAFAQTRSLEPDSFLIVSINERRPRLAQELKSLVRELGLEKDVAAVGSVWDLLPTIYAISSIYCTPAIVEDFGMSAQQAAATQVPVIASHRVPFVTEYLLGDEVDSIMPYSVTTPILFGSGAIVVQADDIDGFAYALELLLMDEDRRANMGRRAYHRTVPFFTWPRMTADFLEQIGIVY
ncbi:MAG: glycosyltransferase [Candidatus Promineifilaceae bacterium]